MTNLLVELGLSTLIVSATVLIHLAGLDLLQLLTRVHLERFATWIDLDRIVVPVGIVLGLSLIHI